MESENIRLQGFFEAIFGNCDNFIEIRLLPSAKQRFVSLFEITTFVERAKKTREDVYFGVCPRYKKDGTAAGVAQAMCAWADLDGKDFGSGAHEPMAKLEAERRKAADYEAWEKWIRDGKETIQTVLGRFEHAPSIIVDSGNGYHAYWLLREPVDVSGDKKLQFKGYVKGLAEALGGDHVQDISRILRVPETLNLKDPAHPKLVRIVQFDPERRYNLSDFEPYWTKIEDRPQAKVDLSDSVEIPARFYDLLKSDAKLKATWRGTRINLHDASRSGYDMALANLLVRHGFTDAEIGAILRASPSGKGASATDQYLRQTIGKTRTSTATTQGAPERGIKLPKIPVSENLILLAQTQCEEFFTDASTKSPFVVMPFKEHREIWPLGSHRFKNWLATEYRAQHGKAPYTQAISDARLILESQAYQTEHELHNRVATCDGALWYDLANPKWQAVKITSGGWTLEKNPPILFRRYAHQRAQFIPVGGERSSVDHIFNVLNFPEDKHLRLLLQVYIITCFIPDIPHPILMVTGAQGSAKSSLFRYLRAIIDPSVNSLLSFPRNESELVRELQHNWCAYYDNVTKCPQWLSDALCRASTGEGSTRRQLFSDDEDVFFSYKRCVGLNGIVNPAYRPDILDRCIVFELARVGVTERRLESELSAAFERARPHILGGIFDVLAKAMHLREQEPLNLPYLPRMADFGLWGAYIAQALGYEHETFLQAYNENIAELSQAAIEAQPVAQAVIALMTNREEWSGTPAELLTELNKIADMEKMDQSKAWPGNARWLVTRLKEAQVNLEESGFLVSISARNRQGRNIYISPKV